MADLRRVLILVGLMVFVLLLVFYERASQNGEQPPSDQPLQVDRSPEEMKQLLEETVRTRWNAMTSGDWLKVYETSSPEFKAKTSLVKYMQGRNKFFYENWSLLDLKVDGLNGLVKIQYDWGVILDVKLDLGEPRHNGVVKEFPYYYDLEDRCWYPGRLGDPPQ